MEDIKKVILDLGANLKFNGRIYKDNSVYINDQKYENVNLNLLYISLCENYLIEYEKSNPAISEKVKNKWFELLMYTPVLTSDNFVNNPGILLNWAKSDWDGRTAYEIVYEEIF